MGGGLFGTPLYLNPKCLLFSLAVIIVYYLPKIKSIEIGRASCRERV